VLSELVKTTLELLIEDPHKGEKFHLVMKGPTQVKKASRKRNDPMQAKGPIKLKGPRPTKVNCK